MTVHFISPSGSVKKLTYIFLFFSHLSAAYFAVSLVGSLSYKTVYGRNQTEGRYHLTIFLLCRKCVLSFKKPL